MNFLELNAPYGLIVQQYQTFYAFQLILQSNKPNKSNTCITADCRPNFMRLLALAIYVIVLRWNWIETIKLHSVSFASYSISQPLIYINKSFCLWKYREHNQPQHVICWQWMMTCNKNGSINSPPSEYASRASQMCTITFVWHIHSAFSNFKTKYKNHKFKSGKINKTTARKYRDDRLRPIDAKLQQQKNEDNKMRNIFSLMRFQSHKNKTQINV